MASKGKTSAFVTVIVILFLLVVGTFYVIDNTDISDDIEEAPKPNPENQNIVRLTPELVEALKRYNEVYEFSEGFARVTRDGKSGFINAKGEEVIPLKYDDADSFSEGVASCKKDGKWGYINTKGEVVIPYKYDAANPFINGIAIVITANKWEYIDKK